MAGVSLIFLPPQGGDTHSNPAVSQQDLVRIAKAVDFAACRLPTEECIGISLQLAHEDLRRRPRATADNSEEFSLLIDFGTPDDFQKKRTVTLTVAATVQPKVKDETINTILLHEEKQPLRKRLDRFVLLVAHLVELNIDSP